MGNLAYLQEPAALIWMAGLLGLVVGSFLNVVIYRLPVMMEREWRHQCSEFMNLPQAEEEEVFDLVRPRSRCPHCGHLIGALENIPLLSYLFQRGRCKHCLAHISLRYPIIEVLSALLVMVLAWHFGLTWQLAGALVMTWALLALTVIDIDHQLLPDGITLPVMWLGIAVNLFGTYTDLESSVIGAMVGYVSLWLVYHSFKLVTGKEGIGFGDFKLFALIGAWLGWQVLPFVLFLSSLAGAVIGIGLILLRGHDRNIPLPFGPYLAMAGWIALLGGEQISFYV